MHERRPVAAVISTVLVGGMLAGGMAIAAMEPAAAAGGWSRPAVVWTAPSGSKAPSGLKQVVDSAGVVTAAWQVVAGGSTRVMAARLGAKGWSKPTTVVRVPNATDYVTTSMVAGPHNEVVIAVAAEGAGGVRFSAARFSSGSWAPAQILGDYPDANSKVSHVYGLSTIADRSGVSVLWQVQPNNVLTTIFVARGFPTAAAGWTAQTVLDDAATGGFSVVRDGAGTVRAVWQHDPDVVSAQGSASGWRARESIGSSGVEASTPPHAYPSTYAAADVDGTVLVTWTPPNASGAFDCPATMSALRTASGWAAPIALPKMATTVFCLYSVRPFVGYGRAPTVVGVNADRFGEYSAATVSAGAAWGPVRQTDGWPYAATSALLALDVTRVNGPSGADHDVQWLTASTLLDTGWSAPQRVSDPAGGWVEDVETTIAADGTFVVIYGKRRPWRSVAVWSVVYSNGAWSAARLVAPPVKARRDSRGAVLATPVAGSDGRVTAAWILDNKVIASSTR
jgi:hypothetical protein